MKSQIVRTDIQVLTNESRNTGQESKSSASKSDSLSVSSFSRNRSIDSLTDPIPVPLGNEVARKLLKLESKPNVSNREP